VAVKVLEHGDDFQGYADQPGGADHAALRNQELSGRRAALLEGAMTSTIKHPHVVATYDYRVVGPEAALQRGTAAAKSQAAGPGVSSPAATGNNASQLQRLKSRSLSARTGHVSAWSALSGNVLRH
jgi:hypothetical protein